MSQPTPTSPASLARGALLGRYVILSTLGQGGMGVVYCAFDPELGRRVAIKVLLPTGTRSSTAQTRLAREAQAMARLAHPNVLAVYDVGTHVDNVFIAMELVEGGSLAEWLEEKKRPPTEILRMFCDAGAGLAAAHAAGLVHRDFKPENVLVGKDGRCRVTDFGLVRLTTESGEFPPEVAEGEADQRGAARSGKLTRAGALVGTPDYMAWEQFEGKPADERSDQYSFCASLYWALFGKAPPGPYSTDDAATLPGNSPRPTGASTARTPQDLTDLPKNPKVPSAIRRALVRGLSHRPERRFPSMDALLSELRKDARAQHRRWAFAGAVAAAAAVAVALMPLVEERRQLCKGGPKKLEAVWSPAIRNAIENAFVATGSPLGADAAQRVLALVDAYGASWTAMYAEACEATRVRGDQSDKVLDLRMVCLERRLQQLGTLTNVFRVADSNTVAKAYDAVEGLPQVGACADVAALTSPVPRPELPQQRAELEGNEKALAEAKALTDSAHLTEAIAITKRLLGASPANPFAPFQAELLHAHGKLLMDTDDIAGAEQALRDALVWAERGHFDQEKLAVLAHLVTLVGKVRGHPEQASLWVELGRAIASRTSDLRARLDLEARIGTTLIESDPEAARRTLENAAVLGAQSFGRDHPVMFRLMESLARAYFAVGDNERALDLFGRALQLGERTRGPNHPDLAWIHRNMARALHRLGQRDQAYEEIRTAIAIWTKVYGPDHRDVANGLDILATMQHVDGSDAEALVAAERALRIKTKVFGKGHVATSYSLGNVADALIGLGRATEALAPLEEALALQEAARFSPEWLAEIRFSYAQALWDTNKDRAKAIVLAKQALESFKKSGDQAHAAAAEKWVAVKAKAKG